MRIPARPWSFLSPASLLPAAILLALLPHAGAAQLAAGKAMPDLDLASTDGSKLTVAVTPEGLVVQRDGVEERPKVLVVHFLQTDCLQCRAQLEPLAALHRDFATRGVLVLGVAYRDEMEAARALRKEMEFELPIAVLPAAAEIKRLAAGDAFGIADSSGTLRYAQAGFGEGDQVLWREVVEALLAGRPAPHKTVARERLEPGDSFPSVALPSLLTDKPMSLRGDKGRLRFTDDRGATREPKAALFFFSRY